jgi:hypothetical protein
MASSSTIQIEGEAPWQFQHDHNLAKKRRGGFGEYDRKGNLYYNEKTKKFGYEPLGDDPMRDGDYTSFSMGNTNYGAPWDCSGVSEADCLICHLKGYQWQERAATLRGRFFKYGPTIGAGWGIIKLSQDEFGNSKVDELTVDYTKKEVTDFENEKRKESGLPLFHGRTEDVKKILEKLGFHREEQQILHHSVLQPFLNHFTTTFQE